MYRFKSNPTKTSVFVSTVSSNGCVHLGRKNLIEPLLLSAASLNLRIESAPLHPRQTCPDVFELPFAAEDMGKSSWRPGWIVCATAWSTGYKKSLAKKNPLKVTCAYIIIEEAFESTTSDSWAVLLFFVTFQHFRILILPCINRLDSSKNNFPRSSEAGVRFPKHL